MNMQDCVWKNLFQIIMRTILQEKGNNSLQHYNLVLLEIKCILHAVVNSLCGLGSCPLVWHMHSVCAHSSHSAEELDSRFASEWETDHLPLS